MPEQKTIPSEPDASEGIGAIEGGSSLMAKIKVAAFVLVVIGGECALFFFFMPSADYIVDAAGRSVGVPSSEEDEGELTDGPVDIPADVVEADLSDFSVTSYIHVTNTHLRIDFKLVGIIKTEDDPEFQTRLESNKHRIREKVIVTVRSMSMADLLEDPALGLLKRKIVISLNRILGKELIQDVIFSDYSVIEQS
ncbi:MAG: flagellar basal body-associated FliL family protein [Candidatus Nealsonbacteria bacterium]|nr:flagellar basal body-associated FliL family protein [Candidatus Nealsonbacteria bacterium]